MSLRDRFFVVALGLAALAGCGDRALNGNPSDEPEVPDPRSVMSFATLYEQNCAGCHGVRGAGGLAVGLGSSGYLAYAPDSAIRDAIAKGHPGTAMPPFARHAGGMLSEEQIDVLVTGIRGWALPANDAPEPPPYVATASGDALRGADAFRAHCASCHGADGRGGPGATSITDSAFLALTSDASLRTTIVAGRPDLGCPDHLRAGRAPMSAQEVSDIVAWLAAQRIAFPGQPYPTATANGSKR